MDLLDLNNPIVIDIRNSYYYSLNHISGALSIPYYNLLNNYGHYLSKDKTYYIYCDYGEKSREVANRLNEFGYRVFSLEGGFLEYKRITDR